MGRTSDASERLKQAILDLMWEGSYGALTIDDICRRAEVKKGSFYYFFESKSDLAVAAVEWLWETQWKSNLDAIFSPSVEPLERLRTYFERAYTNQCELWQKHGKVLGCPVFSLGNEISTIDEKLGAKVREVFSRKRRYVESAIRDGIANGTIPPCDPTEKALSLSGLFEGLRSEARLLNDASVMKNLPRMAFEMLQVKPATTTAG